MTPTHFTILDVTIGLWIASFVLWCVVIPVCVGFLSRRSKAVAILICLAMAAYSTIWAQVRSADFSDVCLNKAKELIRQHYEFIGNAPCTAFAFDWGWFATVLLMMAPGFVVGAGLEWWIGRKRNGAVSAL